MCKLVEGWSCAKVEWSGVENLELGWGGGGLGDNCRVKLLTTVDKGRLPQSPSLPLYVCMAKIQASDLELSSHKKKKLSSERSKN